MVIELFSLATHYFKVSIERNKPKITHTHKKTISSRTHSYEKKNCFYVSAGCGRFFEGNATDMHAALIGKLSKLPNDTNVYCGHEYTLQNLKFAKHVEPNNEDIMHRIEWAKKQRSENIPTVNSIFILLISHVKMESNHNLSNDLFRCHRQLAMKSYSIHLCV